MKKFLFAAVTFFSLTPIALADTWAAVNLGEQIPQSGWKYLSCHQSEQSVTIARYWTFAAEMVRMKVGDRTSIQSREHPALVLRALVDCKATFSLE